MNGSSERVRPPPELARDAHKGDAGRVLCLCGSADMPGAAVLVVRAAYRAGAGIVALGALFESLATIVPCSAPEGVLIDLTEWRDVFEGRLPEALRDRRDDARVVGPGLGRGALTERLVVLLARDAFEGATVLDADALNALGERLELLREARGPLVLTPHPGEAGRLLGREIPSDEPGRIAAAREIAERSGAIVCLKGHRTVVASAREAVFVNDTGNPGMATGGSGDVLAGVLGAYLAACRTSGDAAWTPFAAACTAVHVHGLAGDLAARERGRRGLIASDLIEHLPAAQRLLRDSGRTE